MAGKMWGSDTAGVQWATLRRQVDYQLSKCWADGWIARTTGATNPFTSGNSDFLAWAQGNTISATPDAPSGSNEVAGLRWETV